MPAKVRVGVIGTGGWAEDFHLPVLASHDDAVLAAICGRDGDRAHELADKYGVAQVLTDYRDMISDAGLDAVVVATPEDLHYPMVMAAVQAGLHVLCEKPIAFSAAQSRGMLSAAERAGIKHMVQFTNRGVAALPVCQAAPRRWLRRRAVPRLLLLADGMVPCPRRQPLPLGLRCGTLKGGGQRTGCAHD